MSGVSAVANVSTLVVSVPAITGFSSSIASAQAGDSPVAGAPAITSFLSSLFVSSLAGGLGSCLCVHVYIK